MSAATGPVDVSLEQHNRQVWLVKVPQRLAQAWKDSRVLEQGDLDLGSVTFLPSSGGPAPKRQCIVRVNTDHFEKNDIPPEYKLDFAPPAQPTRVFSHDDTGRVALEGVVKETGNLTPAVGLEYRKLLRERMITSVNSGRTVTALDELPRYTKDSRPQGTFKIEKMEEEEEKPIVPMAAKGARMTEDELKTALFHLFEEKEFWSLKELNAQIRQPEGHLKKVLKEICVYHRSGPNKNNYELKPQYKEASSVPAQS